MYWDDWSTRSIQKANKRDGGSRQTIKSYVRGLMDVKVFHQDVQTGKFNIKININCVACPKDFTGSCLFPEVKS